MNINKVLKYSIIAGIFLIPFIPFLISGQLHLPDMLFPFITGKNFVFRILVEILFGLWVTLAILDNKYLPKKSWILYSALIFMAVLTVADIFSANPYKSFWSNYERMEGWIGHLHLVLYFIVAGTVFQASKLWDWFFHVSIGASLWMSLYGLLQMSHELAIDQGGVRVDGTIGNATYLAVYLLFHVFFLIYFMVARKVDLRKIATAYAIGSGSFVIYYIARISDPSISAHTAGIWITVVSILVFLLSAGFLIWRKMVVESETIIQKMWQVVTRGKFDLIRNRVIAVVAYLVLFVFELIIMVGTATRGAVIALAVGGTLMAVLFTFAQKENKVLRNVGIGFLALIILAGGTFYAVKDTPFVKNSSSLARLSSLATLDVSHFVATEGRSRIAIWSMAWQGVKEHPVLGWGQESFNYLFYKYYQPTMYDQEMWFDRAHNVVFDWLVSAGFLGLLAYLSLFGTALYCLWGKKFRQTSHDLSFAERAVISCLFLAYFIHNLFVFDILVSYILFFSILAYLHSIYGEALRSTCQEKWTLWKETLMAFGIPGIAIVCVFALYFVNVKPLQASVLLVHALGPQPGGLNQNTEMYRDIFDLNTFGNYEAREYLAQTAVQIAPSNINQTEKLSFASLANEQLKKQLQETPNDARYYYFYGIFLNAYGQYQAGLPVWQKAVDISPQKQLFLLNLAGDYRALGDQQNAVKYYKMAYEEAPQYEDAATAYFEVTGQYRQLLQIWKQKEISNPNDFQVRVSMAVIYYQLKDKVNAIKELQTAIALNPAFASQGQVYIQEVQAGKQLK